MPLPLALMAGGLLAKGISTLAQKPMDLNNEYTRKGTQYGYGGQAEKDFIARSEKSKQEAGSYFSRTMANTISQNASNRQKQFAAQGIHGSNVLANEGMKADTARLTEQGNDAYSQYSLGADQQLNSGLLGLYNIGQGYDKMGMELAGVRNKEANAGWNFLGDLGDTAMGMGAGMLGNEMGEDAANLRQDKAFRQTKELMKEYGGMFGGAVKNSSPFDPSNLLYGLGPVNDSTRKTWTQQMRSQPWGGKD